MGNMGKKQRKAFYIWLEEQLLLAMQLVFGRLTRLLQIVTSLLEQPPDLCLYILVPKHIVVCGFGITDVKSLSSL